MFNHWFVENSPLGDNPQNPISTSREKARRVRAPDISFQQTANRFPFYRRPYLRSTFATPSPTEGRGICSASRTSGWSRVPEVRPPYTGCESLTRILVVTSITFTKVRIRCERRWKARLEKRKKKRETASRRLPLPNTTRSTRGWQNRIKRPTCINSRRSIDSDRVRALAVILLCRYIRRNSEIKLVSNLRFWMFIERKL